VLVPCGFCQSKGAHQLARLSHSPMLGLPRRLGFVEAMGTPKVPCRGPWGRDRLARVGQCLLTDTYGVCLLKSQNYFR
jgi:hypothetical protein